MLVSAGSIALAVAGAAAGLPARSAPMARCAPLFGLMSAPVAAPHLVPPGLISPMLRSILPARRMTDQQRRMRCFRLMRG